MSTVIDLLKECSAARIELYLDNGRLRYRAQPGAYTEDLRQRVAVHRDAVIAALEAEPTYVARSFLYSVLRDSMAERATLVSKDIRTEPEALAFLRERFPWLQVQWVSLITHSVCSGCQHYTGGVLCNADQSPDHVHKGGICPAKEARS